MERCLYECRKQWKTKQTKPKRTEEIKYAKREKKRIKKTNDQESNRNRKNDRGEAVRRGKLTTNITSILCAKKR